MWRFLEVQEASQRKSLKGLNNTAADGVDGFEALHKILDELEEVGANKEWCAQKEKMLKKAKLYLKTSYRGHCQEESRCPTIVEHLPRVFLITLIIVQTVAMTMISHVATVRC